MWHIMLSVLNISNARSEQRKRTYAGKEAEGGGLDGKILRFQLFLCLYSPAGIFFSPSFSSGLKQNTYIDTLSFETTFSLGC